MQLENGSMASRSLTPEETKRAMELRAEEQERSKDEATTSKVVAVGEYIVVRAKPRPSMTKAGIHIPDEGEPAQKYGTILSIGAAVDTTKNPLAVGDEVIVGKWFPAQPDIGGHTFLLVPVQAVLGKIERQG